MTTLSSEFVSGFVDVLRWARDEYENAKDPETQREVWTYFVRILHRMAREIDPAVEREALLAPVNDLVLSLFSLDYGIADPPLQPRTLNHRPPSLRWALFRGRAAAASELLIREGAAAPDADSWVAKRLSKEGYQKPGKSADPRITAATIKGWRKAAREGRPDELVRAEFETVLEDGNPMIKQFLPEISAIYKNVQRNGILQSLTVIEMICAHFPPESLTQKRVARRQMA